MHSDNPTASANVRMIDVARLAGVSHQTVSRVVNKPEIVSPGVRDRVEVAIRQLNYRPHTSARALASRSSRTIGIVSFGLAQYGPSVALTGIVDEARRAGYSANLVTLVDVDRTHMRLALDHLIADAVDGIVIIAPIEAAIHAIEGMSTVVPLVVFEPGAHEGASNVGTDEATGAAVATRYLLELGHHTVHHVSGPAGWLGATARERGWKGELEAARRPIPQPIVGDWTTLSGYAAGLVIAADPTATAVFVANDQMALGLIKALEECDIRVPEDLSVIGFDDIPECRYFIPALSTMSVDFERVGRFAVGSILSMIGLLDDRVVRHVVPELVLRSSTAPPPQTRRAARA